METGPASPAVCLAIICNKVADGNGFVHRRRNEQNPRQTEKDRGFQPEDIDEKQTDACLRQTLADKADVD